MDRRLEEEDGQEVSARFDGEKMLFSPRFIGRGSALLGGVGSERGLSSVVSGCV